MVSKTNEQALEAAIEKHLTGICLEELKSQVGEASIPYDKSSLFEIGFATDFNAQYAIDEKKLWEFLAKTQEKELEKLKSRSQRIGSARSLSVLTD